MKLVRQAELVWFQNRHSGDTKNSHDCHYDTVDDRYFEFCTAIVKSQLTAAGARNMRMSDVKERIKAGNFFHSGSAVHVFTCLEASCKADQKNFRVARTLT